jgi:hypothetical protein
MGTVSISGVNYSIYGTHDGAKSYMRARLGAEAWDSASSENQKKSLVSATRWIDRGDWAGDPVTPGQALKFEFRSGLTDCEGNPVATNVVAPGVAEACYELALVLLGDATASAAVDSGSNIKSVAAGSAAVSYFRPTSGSAPIYPGEAGRLLRCYLDSGGASGFASGTDVESQFDNCDEYGLDEGYA